MKTSITPENKGARENDFSHESLSVKDALIWFVITVVALCIAGTSHAQTGIVNVHTSFITSTKSTSYTASGAPGSSLSGNNYQYSFGAATQAGNHLKKLDSFIIGAENYSYVENAISAVKIRRVNNSTVSGNRTLLWVEKAASATNSNIAVVNEYNDNMESVFNDNSLNQGTDNLFANGGDGNGNNNNIERLDVIFRGGVISTINTKVGFALFERGDDNAHDPFVIAPITALDIDGNPTAYGRIVRVGKSSYGNLPSSTTNYYIIRKDSVAESNLRISTSGTQNIGGVFISLNDLGVNPNEIIYGYSVISYDLPTTATSADLVDYTNTAFFPTNTSSATLEGGIDLIALTGVLAAPNSIILPPVALNIINDTLLNTASITPVNELIAKASFGDIANYTIQTIPATEQGILYLCDSGNCIPVTPGQVLAPEQIFRLAFQPNINFTGDVVFYYFATDTYNQLSNIASYTIPVTAVVVDVLPVSILSFNGSIDKKTVQLNWQTSTEINSSYFEIQRSEDGKRFETFATNTAKGNSSTISNYQVKDDLFFSTKNVMYYRVKMVDIDGKFKFSTVLTIKTTTAAATANIKAWPVPFTNDLTIEYNSSATQTIQLSLVNMSGAVVFSMAVPAKQGRNIINLNQAQPKPAGTYILLISDGTKTETVKVVKQ